MFRKLHAVHQRYRVGPTNLDVTSFLKAWALPEKRSASNAAKARAPASKEEVPRSAVSPTDSNNIGGDGPSSLNRPLGLRDPPMPGENTGLDPRDWRTRRDDFFDYDKHLERRQQLTKQVSKPYFRDWSNMRFQKGKVFIAPPKLLRADKALYFPNLWGFTLATPKDEQDTTPALYGRLSIVAVFSGTWAEQQTKTLLEENKKLDDLLLASNGLLQRFDINIEQNRMKAGLVKLFMGSLRRKLPKEQHGKYFLVTQGVTDYIREQMGMFNSQIGYVYLLDTECRVRWACSAEAVPGEKDSMIRGIGRLSKEVRKLIDAKDPGLAFGPMNLLGTPPEVRRASIDEMGSIANI